MRLNELYNSWVTSSPVKRKNVYVYRDNYPWTTPKLGINIDFALASRREVSASFYIDESKVFEKVTASELLKYWFSDVDETLSNYKELVMRLYWYSLFNQLYIYDNETYDILDIANNLYLYEAGKIKENILDSPNISKAILALIKDFKPIDNFLPYFDLYENNVKVSNPISDSILELGKQYRIVLEYSKIKGDLAINISLINENHGKYKRLNKEVAIYLDNYFGKGGFLPPLTIYNKAHEKGSSLLKFSIINTCINKIHFTITNCLQYAVFRRSAKIWYTYELVYGEDDPYGSYTLDYSTEVTCHLLEVSSNGDGCFNFTSLKRPMLNTALIIERIESDGSNGIKIYNTELDHREDDNSGSFYLSFTGYGKVLFDFDLTNKSYNENQYGKTPLGWGNIDSPISNAYSAGGLFYYTSNLYWFMDFFKDITIPYGSKAAWLGPLALPYSTSYDDRLSKERLSSFSKMEARDVIINLGTTKDPDPRDILNDNVLEISSKMTLENIEKEEEEYHINRQLNTASSQGRYKKIVINITEKNSNTQQPVFIKNANGYVLSANESITINTDNNVQPVFLARMPDDVITCFPRTNSNVYSYGGCIKIPFTSKTKRIPSFINPFKYSYRDASDIKSGWYDEQSYYNNSYSGKSGSSFFLEGSPTYFVLTIPHAITIDQGIHGKKYSDFSYYWDSEGITYKPYEVLYNFVLNSKSAYFRLYTVYDYAELFPPNHVSVDENERALKELTSVSGLKLKPDAGGLNHFKLIDSYCNLIVFCVDDDYVIDNRRTFSRYTAYNADGPFIREVEFSCKDVLNTTNEENRYNNLTIIFCKEEHLNRLMELKYASEQVLHTYAATLPKVVHLNSFTNCFKLSKSNLVINLFGVQFDAESIAKQATNTKTKELWSTLI